jgi:hypothetical protein
VCDARREHAIFSEPRVDYPWVFGDVVAPIVGVVVVSLLAAAGFRLERAAVVTYSQRLAVG